MNKKHTKTNTKGLSTFLRARRISAGFTQAQAAQKLGHTSSQYISNYERGLCEPSIETAAKLCKAFGVSIPTLEKKLLSLYSTKLKTVLNL